MNKERMQQVAQRLYDMGPGTTEFVLKKMLGSNKALTEAIGKEIKRLRESGVQPINANGKNA